MAEISTSGSSDSHASSKMRVKPSSYPIGGLWFDRLATSLCLWFVLGLFLDGWAHNHGKVDDTFFTPWHAVLYSGVLAIALHLIITQYRNILRGFAWRQSLPKGYFLSLIGVGVFFIGGGIDFGWHSLFGFEADVEALLSPAHLFLAAGAFLFLGGPVRAAWQRPHTQEKNGWSGQLSLVVGLLLIFSLFTFFTQYGHPFSNARNMVSPPSYIRGTDYFDVSGIASVIIFSALLMGLILLAIHRWVLPMGSLALILGLNTLLMFWMRYNPSTPHTLGLIAGILGGIMTEVLFRRLRPSPSTPERLRVFAFLTPTLIFLCLFLLLLSAGGIAWSIHMWLGVSFLGGVVGLFLSYLSVPPRIPEG